MANSKTAINVGTSTFLVESYVTREGKGNPVVRLFSAEGGFLMQLSVSKNVDPTRVASLASIAQQLLPPVAQAAPTAEPVAPIVRNANGAQPAAPVANPLVASEAARQALLRWEAGDRKGAKNFARANGIKYHGGPLGDGAVVEEWQRLASMRGTVPSAPAGESIAPDAMAALKALFAVPGVAQLLADSTAL